MHTDLVALVYVGGGALPKLALHSSVEHVADLPQLELPLAAAAVTEDAAAGRLSVTVSAEAHPSHSRAGKPLVLRLADPPPDAAEAAAELGRWAEALREA
eukprot:COSAG06_NODE_16205_length_1013_cov_6.281182_2_plen_99_part_01